MTITYRVIKAPHISEILDLLKYRSGESFSSKLYIDAVPNLPRPANTGKLNIIQLESFKWIPLIHQHKYRITGILADEYHYPEGRKFSADINCISQTGEARVESS